MTKDGLLISQKLGYSMPPETPKEEVYQYNRGWRYQED
jgi:hypothetical protein